MKSFSVSEKCLHGSEGMNQRNGTDVDAANAMKVFSKLGYKVKIYNDRTVEQMKQILISGEFCRRIHTKRRKGSTEIAIFSVFVFQHPRMITRTAPHSSAFC